MKYQKHDRIEQLASYVQGRQMRLNKIWEAQVLVFVGCCFFFPSDDDDKILSGFSRSSFVLSQSVNHSSALGVERMSQQLGWRRKEEGLNGKKLVLYHLPSSSSHLPPKGGLNTHTHKICNLNNLLLNVKAVHTQPKVWIVLGYSPQATLPYSEWYETRREGVHIYNLIISHSDLEQLDSKACISISYNLPWRPFT